MITVSQAEEVIRNTLRSWGSEQVPINECNGRILLEPLITDRDMPPFHRVTMDGIAINYDSWSEGNAAYKIEGIASAGSPQMTLNYPNACIEVMTGAMLPLGSDTVIRYEDLLIESDNAQIQLESLTQGANIHRQGSDRKEGSLLIKSGARINPGIINIAATVGKSYLEVARLPKTLIFSTGDELVPIHATPLSHQIRRSNVHMVRSALQSLGIHAFEQHVNDDDKKIKEVLSKAILQYDLIILSGGVSMGKFDFVPKVMSQLGVAQHFHKVKQRPGKPLWFGTQQNGSVIFGLPGNPASSLACTCRYIIPWIKHCLGQQESLVPMAILSEDVEFKKQLTYFLQVRLESLDGQLIAFPEEGNGSGDLANLGVANAFLELPRERSEFYKGERYPVYAFGQ